MPLASSGGGLQEETYRPASGDLSKAKNAELAIQVERILQSNTFRHSQALRLLLKFLTAKVGSGEADQLNEYSIAIDCLGKPATYDSRHDSTVRIQMGRLRRKLAEYYQNEGEHNPFRVELPKGSFKLVFEEHAEPASLVMLLEKLAASAVIRPRLVVVIVVLAATSALTLAWGSYVTVRYSRLQKDTALFRAMWTPELSQLWQPFLDGRGPVVLAITNPPFVEFKGFGVYREVGFVRWDKIIHTPSVEAIRKSLKNPEIGLSEFFTPGGEVNACFVIGELLGPRVPTLSLLRVDKLSWQQIAENNVLYIGPPGFFADQLIGMPVDVDFLNAGSGIQNLHPRVGEPSRFVDTASGTELTADGEYYALITHVPGPLGKYDVESFTGGRTAVRLGAVQWFTDATYARILINKMKKPSGELPRYYQVVLKVKFKDGVPTETSFILYHELRPTGRVGLPAAEVSTAP
jgi:hypothetical protein